MQRNQHYQARVNRVLDYISDMEMFVRLPEEIGWETFDLHTCIRVVRL